jgi:predicted nucleic acid-binding protein
VSVVLDSSVTIAWMLKDERTEATDDVLKLVALSGAVVPAIWHLEVANSLQHAFRRRRLDLSERDAAFVDLSRLKIVVDAETHLHAWSRTFALVERFGLTAYDAAYLEVADRRALSLATLDHDLRRASAMMGITLLGE